MATYVKDGVVYDERYVKNVGLDNNELGSILEENKLANDKALIEHEIRWKRCLGEVRSIARKDNLNERELYEIRLKCEQSFVAIENGKAHKDDEVLSGGFNKNIDYKGKEIAKDKRRDEFIENDIEFKKQGFKVLKGGYFLIACVKSIDKFAYLYLLSKIYGGRIMTNEEEIALENSLYRDVPKRTVIVNYQKSIMQGLDMYNRLLNGRIHTRLYETIFESAREVRQVLFKRKLKNYKYRDTFSNHMRRKGFIEL